MTLSQYKTIYRKFIIRIIYRSRYFIECIEWRIKIYIYVKVISFKTNYPFGKNKVRQNISCIYLAMNYVFGNLTVLSGIRDLCHVQNMNRYDARPTTVDTMFYSDSYTTTENRKHLLENDTLVKFRGVGLPLFACRSLIEALYFNSTERQE